MSKHANWHSDLMKREGKPCLKTSEWKDIYIYIGTNSGCSRCVSPICNTFMWLSDQLEGGRKQWLYTMNIQRNMRTKRGGRNVTEWMTRPNGEAECTNESGVLWWCALCLSRKPHVSYPCLLPSSSLPSSHYCHINFPCLQSVMLFIGSSYACAGSAIALVRPLLTHRKLLTPFPPLHPRLTLFPTLPYWLHHHWKDLVRSQNFSNNNYHRVHSLDICRSRIHRVAHELSDHWTPIHQ